MPAAAPRSLAGDEASFVTGGASRLNDGVGRQARSVEKPVLGFGVTR